MTNQEHVPVLIVGAGDAGLSLSLLLLQQGIHSVLIERRSGISWVPRARNLNFRSLEVFRGLGLATDVRAAGSNISQMLLKERLADSKQENIFDPTQLMAGLEAISPDQFGWYCPQSRLEPLLLAATYQRGGDVRYDTELVSFTQEDNGVTATLQERTTGGQYVIHSDFLAACDGAHSHIRLALGIEAEGIGTLPEYFTFVYFHAPWQQFIAGHDADSFLIRNADVQGIFIVIDEERGMFLLTDRLPQRGDFEGFTNERWKDLIVKAIGQDIPVEILEVAHWQPAENVATQFQQGRVFLVGDSAHTMPAYKGLGANTAIQSAQNLAWKLACVIRGQAGRELLTTYQTERHPVGRFAAHQSLTGPGAAWLQEGTKSVSLPEEQDLPLFYPIVGYRYRSRAILAEDASASSQDEIELLEREALTGLPGTRVPHLWLERQEQRISTLNLLDGCFVLLTGTDGAAWCEAAAGIKASLGIELATYRIGPGADLYDSEDSWSARLGIAKDGAMLLRPDGFVAWRSTTLAASPEKVLEQVFSHALCRI